MIRTVFLFRLKFLRHTGRHIIIYSGKERKRLKVLLPWDVEEEQIFLNDTELHFPVFEIIKKFKNKQTGLNLFTSTVYVPMHWKTKLCCNVFIWLLLSNLSPAFRYDLLSNFRKKSFMITFPLSAKILTLLDSIWS